MRRSRLSLVVALTMTTSAAVVALPTAASAAPGDIPVQFVAMNDFHGRVDAFSGGDSVLTTSPGPDGNYTTTGDNVTETVAGSAHVAATVRNLQSSFTDTTGSAATWFVGAGDLISGSAYESSVFKDEPTIEVLNAMGLDASSVGNHEFDRGTDELRRVSGVTDETYTDDISACEGVAAEDVNVEACFLDSQSEPFHGTEFPYLAANVLDRTTGQPMLPPYQIFDVDDAGTQMAVIGVVTETTPTIVSPDGVTDVEFIDEAEAVNNWVPILQGMGIEAIGVLVHEGGSTSGPQAPDYNGCAGLTGPIVDINAAVAPAVDLIVSAHTHQAYNCRLDVAGGEPRLVTSAGYYGRLVSDIRLTVNSETGDVVRSAAYSATNVPVSRTATPASDVQEIVDYWVARSAEAGSVVVGEATGPILRGRNETGTVVRDRESSLGNLVAQTQYEALQEEQFGFPEVAFMNPGGLRDDIQAGEVTYRELFNVQNFGNTVNATTLTGAAIKQLLEQQFPSAARSAQLWLGTSDNFSYTYDPACGEGARIDADSIVLNGEPLDLARDYRVAANSFLITGGDSFTAFRSGTAPVTGPVDVDASVEYFQDNSPVEPPAADHATRTADSQCDATAMISAPNPTRLESVTVTGASFTPNQPVTATLADGRVLGTAAADAAGAVSIAFRVPSDLAAGEHTVTLTSTSGEKASTTFTLGTVGSDVKTVVTTLIQKLLAWLRGR